MKKIILTCLFISSLTLFSYESNLKSNLDKYLKEAGYTGIEGNICGRKTTQPDEFRKIINQNPFIKKICEIGFNAGHSSLVFLETKKDIQMLSFDLGSHPYVFKAKQFIDNTFPGRHKLILGDSRKTVPEYYKNHKTEKFDLIFIDGGHTTDVAFADITNLRKMAHKDTILVLDDTRPGNSVTKAVLKAEEQKLIKKPIFKESPRGNKHWVVTKYRL